MTCITLLKYNVCIILVKYESVYIFSSWLLIFFLPKQEKKIVRKNLFKEKLFYKLRTRIYICYISPHLLRKRRKSDQGVTFSYCYMKTNANPLFHFHICL